RIDRLQQRAFHEKRFAVELAVRTVARQRVRRIEDAELEQLPRIVPFVQRVTDVEPLVALQADQIGPERRSQRPGERRLPDAGLSFEEQRPFETQREKERHGETAVRYVSVLGEPTLEVVSRCGKNDRGL